MCRWINCNFCEFKFVELLDTVYEYIKSIKGMNYSSLFYFHHLLFLPSPAIDIGPFDAVGSFYATVLPPGQQRIRAFKYFSTL